jgi:hypothetical protein
MGTKKQKQGTFFLPGSFSFEKSMVTMAFRANIGLI